MSTPSRRTLLLSLIAGALPWSSASAATPLQLASIYTDTIDPEPFLVSEKFDGVRGYWDGTTLRFRSGRVVPAPASFAARLPRTPLDGELWLGRSRFDELSALVRRTVPDETAWRQVRYMVFDLPGAEEVFSKRVSRIADLVRQSAWPQLVAVEQQPAGNRAALQRRLSEVVSQGGEGLVLHRANAPYRSGRSDALLKLKPELDAEARVIAHRAGQGRFEGQLGAIEVRTPDGRQFLIGTGFSEAQRRDPPPVGSVVTYRYRDLTSSGLPRFASFLRVHRAL